jgi:hypothetical protein
MSSSATIGQQERDTPSSRISKPSITPLSGREAGCRGDIGRRHEQGERRHQGPGDDRQEGRESDPGYRSSSMSAAPAPTSAPARLPSAPGPNPSSETIKDRWRAATPRGAEP